MKKPKRTTQRNKCDRIWSELIRQRNGGRCEVCQAENANNPHHVISRRNLTLRHDLRNGVLLCPSHHTFSSKESAHLDPVFFMRWFEVNRKEDYNYLCEKREEMSYKVDYEERLKELKALKEKGVVEL